MQPEIGYSLENDGHGVGAGVIVLLSQCDVVEFTNGFLQSTSFLTTHVGAITESVAMGSIAHSFTSISISS